MSDLPQAPATEGVERDQERRGRILLGILSDVVDPQINRQLARDGASQVCHELLTGASTLRRAAVYRARIAALDGGQAGGAFVDSTFAAVDRAIEAMASLGGRVLIPTDGEWPSGLDDLDDRRPYALYVRGGFDLADLDGHRSIAIVGARAATQYGEHVATDLGAELARRGWVVVSGGAYGIDAAAHRGAVVSGGGTVAVLANGIDEVYPKGNAQLFSRIIERGAIVSELPPGRHPTRQGFLARNRIIAALAGGTLVVEAAMRSGSASTVTRAVELGREVMAVPGPITSVTSMGTHALLRDGATLITSADDVVEALSGVGSTPENPLAVDASERDALGSSMRAVLDAFPARRSVDEATVAIAAGLELVGVVRALGLLVAGGWVERSESGWRLTYKARRS